MADTSLKDLHMARFGRYDGIQLISAATAEADYLTYRLLRYDGDDGGDIFSILVSYFRDGSLYDEEFVPDATRSKEDAQKIVSVLYSNAVTPSSLFEIMDGLEDYRPQPGLIS